MDTTEIQGILRGYYVQLYVNKVSILEEMKKFPETFNIPWLNPEEIKNLNRLIATKEIESVIKNLPTKKSSRLDDFTAEFYQTFQKLTPILFKLFLKIE